MISRNIFKTLFVLAAGAALIASCDSEYNDIGADIIDGDIHHNGMERYEGSVVAYDHATGAVQANNLPLNSFGIYDNPAFGKTTAHYVTQVELATVAPKISTEALIDSVYLYVPYFSKYKSTDASGLSTYELDSVYRSNPAVEANMTLKIYRNGYFLRTTDPGSEGSGAQKYYSNKLYIANGVDQSRLELLAQNNSFKIVANEIERKANVSGSVKIVERFAPGIYMPLDPNLIKDAILDLSQTSNLVNNNVFKNYFRGIYFNIAQNGTSGDMASMRFGEGKIVIIYKDRPLKLDGVNFDTEADRIKKVITLNMKGNTINFFENDYKSEFLNKLTPANTNVALGDSRLYIKGGAGSMGVIKILSLTEIEALRAERILINEANLIFYVDQESMKDASGKVAPNPLRLYLYDLKNNIPLFDYYSDATISTLNQKYDKRIYGGIGSRFVDANGQTRIRYKIRLTNHINNILHGEGNPIDKNVPLGLVLTENINVIANAAVESPFQAGLVNVETLPLGSVISPFGTVLYGNNIPANDPDANAENMKLRLEIYYTKPN